MPEASAAIPGGASARTNAPVPTSASAAEERRYAAIVGCDVCEQRLNLGMTQAELADAAGVSRHLVSDLESGKATGISLGKLVRILDALGMRLQVKVGVPVSPSPSQAYPAELQKYANQIAEQLKGTRHVFG